MELVKEFEIKKPLYEVFGLKVKQLINELLIVDDTKIHHLSQRTKDISKLKEKISRKGNKYSNLNEITDLSGIRIITFFAEDVDKIAEIIKSEFEVDHKNTIDKRDLAEDKFGYMSMHYVVSIAENRSKLAEYKQFKGLKLEIQIRSILQHGWAEIEHDLGYKGAKGIPSEFKRDFNRVAALLETSDKEFDRLKRELQAYNEQVKADFTKEKVNYKINAVTLKEFCVKNEQLKNMNELVAQNFGVSLDEDLDQIDFGELSETLKRNDIQTITQLESSFVNHMEVFKQEVPNIVKSRNDKFPVSGVDKSVGIYMLLQVIKNITSR